MIKRLLTAAVAVTATTAGLLVSTGPAQAVLAPAAQPTNYALFAAGYASRVHGGGLPADSGATAFAVIGCTNRSGLNKVNAQAAINLDGLATISTAKTRTWTTHSNSVVAANGRNTIADVTLLDFGSGSLALDAIRGTARSWHGADGRFHSSARASLGSITLTLGGISTSIPVPRRGESVTIPGVAKVTLGAGVHRSGSHQSRATINAVTVNVIPTGTTLILGHATSRIHDGVASALFRASSFGARLSLVGGVVSVGKTPNLVMACQGTEGTTEHRDLASVSLGDLGSAAGLSTSQRSHQSATSAVAWEKAQVASVSLLGGSLAITGVTGRAHASYTARGKVHTDTHGTTLATVSYNGSQLTFPAHGALVIPGVASLLPRVVTRTKHSVDVTALRVTLLDGSGATLDLGRARVGIRPSGL